jgi:hypothetical protein
VLNLDGSGELERPRRWGATALLAERDFRLLWLSGGLAGTIRWLDTLATGIFIYELTGSPLWVSASIFFRLLPLLVLG